jgi:hypothetical protein
MTLADLRAKAELANRWRPSIDFGSASEPLIEHLDCGACPTCRGAQRAVDEVHSWIENSVRSASDEHGRFSAHAYADKAARIESYFGDPGPVAEFAAAVREFCQ